MKPAFGTGNVVLKCESNRGLDTKLFRLENVLYIPCLRVSLISASVIARKGYTIVQKMNTCIVTNTDHNVGNKQVKGVHYLET